MATGAWDGAWPTAASAVDLATAGITTMLWATGFTGHVDWVHGCPETPRAGRRLGGVAPMPGHFCCCPASS